LSVLSGGINKSNTAPAAETDYRSIFMRFYTTGFLLS